MGGVRDRADPGCRALAVSGGICGRKIAGDTSREWDTAAAQAVGNHIYMGKSRGRKTEVHLMCVCKGLRVETDETGVWTSKGR